MEERAKAPKRNIDQVMFTKDGVQIIGISGKDVSENNEKLILSYVWSLILHYSIGGAATETKYNNINQVIKSAKNFWVSKRKQIPTRKNKLLQT